MPAGTKAPAKKAGTKKAPAKRAAKTTKAATPLEKITKLVKSSGAEGIAVKDLAAQAGVTQDTARKAVTKLVNEGKARRDGPGIVKPVGAGGRRSEDVVERDAKILEVIKASGKEGLTLVQVAEAVDCTRQLAYESVWRLRKAEKVHRSGSTRNAVWVSGKGR